MNIFIHQGAEWYGSDVIFWGAVTSLAGDTDKVILPQAGLLSQKLLESGITVDTRKFSKLVRRAKFRTYLGDALKMLFDIFSFYQTFKRADRIYISTIVLPQFIFLGLLLRKQVIVHVHELPPRFLRVIFRRAEKRFGAHFKILTVSKWLNNELGLQHSSIVTNFIHPEKIAYQKMKSVGVPFIFAYIGRFNSWKGQEVILKAALKLEKQGINGFEIHFYGNAYSGKEHFYDEMVDLVNQLNCPKIVKINDFSKNIKKVYNQIDCLIVPSKKKEPFGLVVIEALANGVPVIASDQPTFLEILNANNLENGLFKADDVRSLLDKMINIMNLSGNDIKLMRSGGIARSKRYSLANFRIAVHKIWAEL